MNIVNFEKEHINEAKGIALANYLEEKQFVKELPQVNDIPDLSEFAENGLGVAALEDGKLVGYLCCYRPWDHAFDSIAKGTFSPIHAHGAVLENREKIYGMLYQAAAEKWVAQGITYHAIALYAHDEKALRTLFRNGFGARCADAVRSMDAVDCLSQPDFVLRELPKEEIAKIRDLRRRLSNHLGSSPCFMNAREQDFQNWLVGAESRESQVYVAERKGLPVSFIEVESGGENFIAEAEGMNNICGAFCLPEYRGTGIFANLLNDVICRLRQQGVKYLGVDYETINPTANGAWNKYFTSYTCSVVRRIDECALQGTETDNMK